MSRTRGQGPSTHGQAEQWHRIESWLVPSGQHTALLTWLEGRSLTNRWMPEGPDRHSLLFADFPPAPGPWTDPDPDAWHVSTFVYPEENDVHGLDDTDEDEDQDLATPGTTAAPTAVTDFDDQDSAAARRRRLAEKQHDTLADLAERWADGPVEEKDDWLKATLAAQPHGRIDQATDSTGQPITAVPTTQTYSWSAQSSDCSLDASVSVTMLNDPQLRNSGLRRDPDLPHWYDTDGRLQVQYLSWDAPRAPLTASSSPETGWNNTSNEAVSASSRGFSANASPSPPNAPQARISNMTSHQVGRRVRPAGLAS